MQKAAGGRVEAQSEKGAHQRYWAGFGRRSARTKEEVSRLPTAGNLVPQE